MYRSSGTNVLTVLVKYNGIRKMSTETPGMAGGDSVHPYECENAEQYAIERLKQEDEPVKAAELAGEYECSPGHMRDVLRKASEVQRVSRGLYALSTDDDSTETETEIDRPSADGPLLSPVTGGADGGPDSDETGLVECPVEGCDYEGDDKMALRGHANSMLDHDWEEVKTEVENDMETEDAIEVQRDRAFDSEDDDQDDAEIVEVEETTETGMAGIPVELVIVAAVAMFVFWWLFLSSGSSDDEQTEDSDDLEDMIGDGNGLI
jgi:hypothetical protein